VPLKELAFIATSASPNLIQEIADAEHEYLKSMQTLDLFNRYRADFERTHPPIAGTLDKNKNVGQTIATPIELSTGDYYLNNLYKQVDLASPKMRQTIDNVSAFIKQNFKGRKAIKIEADRSAYLSRHA
jgi:hypothetical protein